jgi:hypothetical protein
LPSSRSLSLWYGLSSAAHFKHEGHLSDIETVFSGLYSDKFFEANQPAFFSSLHAFDWMNFSVLWRLYLLVIAIGLFFNLHDQELQPHLESLSQRMA